MMPCLSYAPVCWSGRRAATLLIFLNIASAFSPPAISLPRRHCYGSSAIRSSHHHRRRHHHKLHELSFRNETFAETEGGGKQRTRNTEITSDASNENEVINDGEKSKLSNNGSTNKEKSTTPNKSNSKSAQRLLKAKRLLEMAQVSPSQRLEMEEARKSAFNSTNGISDDATVVPMGSYSLRFGGYGSLEEELEQQGVSEMRMADTFDSLDNLVDSKSLLPGGRWVETNGYTNNGAVNADDDTSLSAKKGGEQSTSTNSSSEMEQRKNIAASGQVAQPLVRYDPVAADKLLFLRPNVWLVRNVQIAFPFGFWIAGVLLDNLLGCEQQKRTHRAQQLTEIICSMGPAIIKAGQALASRPDLLPGEYLDELQKLQDDVPTFSNDIAFRIVEEELQQKFDDVFELVEPDPIAAASIGQVYKGRLLKNGQTVAIKIQRPNTEEIVALDLYVLRWWGGVYNKIFQFLGRDINLQSVMDDFGQLLYAEIDYVAEGANARRFSELYAQDVAIADVFVPKVYSELTTRKLLTMEWVDGFRLTDSESLEANNLDKKKLVDTLVQCSLRQILENGFFHADPHAGNLLATPDGRLCYLDFGMMSYAAAAQRNGFLLAVVHIVNRDWGELVRVYQKLGFIPDGTDVQPIELALEDALPDVLNADISELNFKTVVGKLGDIMYKFPFSLPPFYISIIRCLGVLEGLAIQVDPKSRIISEAYPYVANRVLTDDSQEELREALRRLIFTTEGKLRWNRLESLLDEAKESSGFNVVMAVDKLVDYVLSSEGEQLLDDIVDQVVEEADSLGRDSLLYISQAAGALAIRDEKAAARALRTLVDILQNNDDVQSEHHEVGTDATPSSNSGINKMIHNLEESLPEPTVAMERAWKISLLLGTRGASSLAATTNSNAAANTANTISQFVPLVRKLSQEPRIRRKANEVVARLGERLVSRGLRATFGLPPPVFEAVDAVKDANKSKTVPIS